MEGLYKVVSVKDNKLQIIQWELENTVPIHQAPVMLNSERQSEEPNEKEKGLIEKKLMLSKDTVGPFKMQTTYTSWARLSGTLARVADWSMWCNGMVTVGKIKLPNRPSTYLSTLSTLTGVNLTSAGSESLSWELCKAIGQY